MKGSVEFLSRRQAIEFIFPKHYSGRIPQISYAFGWKINGNLVAAMTVGKPASNSLCEGICGKDYANSVYELNRLCRSEDLEEPLSQFVGACLRRLRPHNMILVSYADTAMNHHGYIYQACNFMYTGITKERTDKFVDGNKHSRHYKTQATNTRKKRSAKHRYVFFCTHDRRKKKEWETNLQYATEPFPKGDNINYKLGSYQGVSLVIENGEEITEEYTQPKLPLETMMGVTSDETR